MLSEDHRGVGRRTSPLPSRRPRTSLPPSRRRLVASLERWWVFRRDRAAAALRDMCAEALELEELRLVEVAALSVLADCHGLSQSALGERIGLDRTSVSCLVEELEEGVLVQRSPDPLDARRRVVELKRSGRQALATAHARLREAEERFLAPLYEHERDELRDILRHLEPPPPALGDLDWLAPRRDAG